jgi:DNA-binding MarR family transcriptional regulator
LWARDGCTQKELSEELGLTQPTTVSAMDNLEKRKLIKRKTNKQDRRKTNIYLTPLGHELRDGLIGHAAEVNRLAVAELSPAEVETLVDLLTRINVSLDAVGQEPGD